MILNKLNRLSLLIGLMCCVLAGAQSPEAALQKWAKLYPIEKVYLHFDRDHYLAGETAWFKAYLSSDYLPDTISTNLQVELLKEGSPVQEKIILPVFAGTTNGQIHLPDSLWTGMYTVRAFTPAMAMHAPDYIFKKGIFIHGKKSRDPAPLLNPAIRIDFFPEGGNLVTGFNSFVAFKAVNENGLPVKVKGNLSNSKGEVLAAVTDYHDGMGIFELKPVAGEKYTVTLTGSVPGKFDLPDPVERGIVLSVMPHPQGNFFEVQQRTSDPDFIAAYMIGQMQHRVVFKHEFAGAKESFQGVLDTRHLQSGILQVTVFNRNGMPLAERLCFVNNREYMQPVSLLADTINLSAKGRNRFRISLPDTVQGSISVSVTDADYEPGLPGKENIFSGLLLTSDLKGYIHHPAYYFSGNSDSINTAADLLMMTNGWRRFRWTELSKQNTVPGSHPAYITISGRANLKGTNRPFADKSLLLFMSGMGSKKSRNSYMLETDREGNFLIDSLLFFDRHRLLFSDTRGKKSQLIDITLKSDSLRRHFSAPGFAGVPDWRSSSYLAAKWQNDYEEILRANGLMLEGITLKTKVKTPMQDLEERYTSGLFNGDATRAIDLVHSDEAVAYNNIFEYLQFRVNGLQITSEGFDYAVFFRQGASISSMGNIPMTIFLDEIETDASVIASIPANQVALVKIYNSFAGSWGNAPGGVLAIYTKKYEDYKGTGVYSNMVIYDGYSVVKDFFAPNYSVVKTTERPDNRITLDWRPSIFINSINPRIPVSFYNNDRTRRFRIVVAGMTTTGKLVWLEKIIDGKE